MLKVFQTDDGTFHQAMLSLNKIALVRLVVEMVPPAGDAFPEWEWTVWPASDLWDHDGSPVSGREASLPAAQRQALETGTSILADLMRDRVPDLPAQWAMQPGHPWHVAASATQHPS